MRFHVSEIKNAKIEREIFTFKEVNEVHASKLHIITEFKGFNMNMDFWKFTTGSLIFEF